MRALFVINPQSRKGRTHGDAVRRELTERGIELVSDPARSFDAIVVAGGDGSIARSIGLAIRHDAPMGIVPLGTFNDLARTLGIPFDIGGACSVISHERTRTIDVARVNDAYYLTEASIGISSRIARLQTTHDKQRLGVLAIVKSVLVGVRYLRPFHARIEFDGNKIAIESVQLTVANSNRFGGLINIEDAAIDDGWLDLYSIQIDRPTRIFSVVAALLAGKRHRAAGLSTYRSAAFTVTTRRPHRITADGEPAGTTPARFEILPRSLHVFAPAAPLD